MRYRWAWVAALLFTSPVSGQIPNRTLVGVPERIDAETTLTYPLDLNKLGLYVPRIVGDQKMDRRLHGSRTIFYRLPQVYQQWTPQSRVRIDDGLGGISFVARSPVWGIYRSSVLAEFNANGDFPWESTFGLNVAHREKKIPGTYDVFNILSLPEDDDGRVIPVVVLGDERPIKWLFPPGTVVGEVIYTIKDGAKYVQEVRTRTKSEDARTWFPGVYRPVANRAEFQRLLQIAYEPQKKFMSFRNPEEDEVFSISGTVERLPTIDPEAVKALLARPFQNVTEEGWHPAADVDFHILPKDYSLGLLKEIDSKACANCHRQTQISVRNLIPRETKIVGDPAKVGNIRGSDAVFTWHPFAPQSVLASEKQPMGGNVFLRRFDAENRLVQILARGQQPSRDYKLTRFVQESLKGYELPADGKFLHPVKKACDCGEACPCGKDQCTCGADCDCKPGRWEKLVDNRATIPADQTAPPPPQMAELTWYRIPGYAGQLHLWDGKDYIGVYETDAQTYRTLKNNVVGPVVAPPIPVP